MENFVLTAARTNIVTANKEGIVSLAGTPSHHIVSANLTPYPISGYLAIHLLGLSTGTLILPNSPSYFRRQQKRRRRDSNDGSGYNGQKTAMRQNGKIATELASYAVIWWSLLGFTSILGISTGVSRRMVSIRDHHDSIFDECSLQANLLYVLWVAAFNITFILGYLLLEMYFFPSPTFKTKEAPSKLTVPDGNLDVFRPPVRAPVLLEAINKNGLFLFLAVRFQFFLFFSPMLKSL